jgi:glutamyl-tRNA reductase
MRRAISVGKKVRTDTAIGNSTVSVGTAGVGLAEQVLGSLKGRVGLVIGAGELAELVAVSLKTHGLSELLVSNRTQARAEELSNKVGGRCIAYEDLAQVLERIDVAVVSTAAQQPILTRELLAPVMRARRNRPLFLLDLAVPRNVASDVQDLEGAYVFNIDDLQAVAQKGREKRQEEAAVAEALVSIEAERCYKSLDALNAGPFISAMTQRADEIVAIERQRTHAVLEGMEPDERKAVEAMNRAMTKRLLHDPIRLAKKLAEEGRSEDLELLAEAFGLELSALHTQEVE